MYRGLTNNIICDRIMLYYAKFNKFNGDDIMEKQYVLYNPHANNGRGEAQARTLESKLTDCELVFCDMTTVESYSDFFATLSADDGLIICGGDGTLNRFVNDTEGINIPVSVYYYPAGSGNDFAHDMGKTPDDAPFCIDACLKDLPTVYVNGIEQKFINGIGYGLDGYCCDVGDEIRRTSTKKVNYTNIAIKGVLFHFKPRTATVTVDGVTTEYKNVWVAPAMNGRFYGGGMMAAPTQDRLNSERELTLVIFNPKGRIKTLSIFPSIFKGEHINKANSTKLIKGKDIYVKFNCPTALQIDGETIRNVTEYRAVSSTLVNSTTAEQEATVNA